MKKIRKGDRVSILSGCDKGKQGDIIRVVDNGRKVLVQGINIIKKHTKPNPQLGTAGGIIEKEAPIFLSKVGLYNPATKKPDTVGFRTLEDGKKVRYFKSNGEVVDG